MSVCRPRDYTWIRFLTYNTYVPQTFVIVGIRKVMTGETWHQGCVHCAVILFSALYYVKQPQRQDTCQVSALPVSYIALHILWEQNTPLFVTLYLYSPFTCNNTKQVRQVTKSRYIESLSLCSQLVSFKLSAKL